MPLIQTTIRLRNTDLANSLRLLAKKADKFPAHLANRACYYIAVDAHKNMPKVMPSQVEADMNSTISGKEMTTGATFSPKLQRNRSLTMAQRIVLARMHPNSEFNRRTGHVFQLTPPPGDGGSPTRNRMYRLVPQSRRAFWQWVDEHAARMKAARKKSTGFYKLCANVVKFIFYAEAQSKTGGSTNSLTVDSVEALAGDGNVSKNIGRVAGGRLASGSSGRATASFWVTATEPDTKGDRRDLDRVARPIWQNAVDKVAQGNLRHYAEKIYKESIRSVGIKVS